MTLLSGEDSTVVCTITVESSRRETVTVNVSNEEEVHSISPVTLLVPWEVTLYCTPDGPGGGTNSKKVEGQNEFKDY